MQSHVDQSKRMSDFAEIFMDWIEKNEVRPMFEIFPDPSVYARGFEQE